jgi:hypothetical protein
VRTHFAAGGETDVACDSLAMKAGQQPSLPRTKLVEEAEHFGFALKTREAIGIAGVRGQVP